MVSFKNTEHIKDFCISFLDLDISNFKSLVPDLSQDTITLCYEVQLVGFTVKPTTSIKLLRPIFAFSFYHLSVLVMTIYLKLMRNMWAMFSIG